MDKIIGLDLKIKEMAARIKELRLVTGLSVEEMAARTGTSVAEYEECEAGNRNLSVAFLYHCALSFGVDMGDILEGKKTFLMVQALSRASEQEREVLCTTHMRADISDAEKIATIKALYDKLDVRRIAEQQIELRFERALAVLDTLSIAGERTATLVEFARNLMGRKK